MSTEAKVREVEQFSDVLQNAKSVVLTDFTGLNVEALSELRGKCRDAGVKYRVIKNTLAKRCVENAGMVDLTGLLEGPNAWATHPEDQVVTAKVLADFAKEHENLKIRAGFMEGRVLTVAEVEALAKLPGREQLLGQVAGMLQSPMAGFVGVLAAVMRGFATAVDAYRQKRADSEGAS